MSKRRKKQPQRLPKIDEEFRITIENEVDNFLKTDALCYNFTHSLSKNQRAFIHTLAAKLQLGSRSSGKEPNRTLKIFKKDVKIQSSIISLALCNDSMDRISIFLRKYYLLDKLKVEGNENELEQRFKNKSRNKLFTIIPKVPPVVKKSQFVAFRQTLPIWSYQYKLVEVIDKNQVVIITGQTGSGKTTQVPQFIIDYSVALKRNCRIICTEPRRLSAISVAERVSSERGEEIGQTVGYQVHLESKISNNTLLTYCTNGVLLRTLMNGMDFFKTVTHVIVDEVHERDKYTDFLLICLRECLQVYKHLKVILMSATIDTTLFDKYFTTPFVIDIPGRLFEVRKYYLENILSILNYAVPQNCDESFVDNFNSLQLCDETRDDENKTELNADLKEQTDKCLQDCWLNGNDNNFMQLIYLYQSENVPVNYQHSGTGITGLIAACIHNKCNIVEQILYLEPDLNLSSSNNMTASDWAKKQGHDEIIQMLLAYQLEIDNVSKTKAEQVVKTKEQKLLISYHNSISQTELDHIDFKLAVELIVHIHLNMPEGSILFFLAGYDDIIAMKELITVDNRMTDSSYVIFALHSSIEMATQREIFLPVRNKRKIILSTNIAETSITIDDVVYVIDSGKVKEKSFDAVNGVCMLRSEWISRSCASQRAGRAGRTKAGICYRLFSELRFNSMQEYATPEILRSPLHELCLHTKVLSPIGSSISDFLNKALEPPPSMIVKNAVQSLKIMGALDENENLTRLGKRLLKLSIEPHLAKIILYGIIVKCFDPVLTIACCLSSKDPFVLPFFPTQKQEAAASRQTLSSGKYSDHMVFLKAFQEWQKRSGYAQKSFCHKNYLNNSTLEVITATRNQIISQLRSSDFIKGSLNSLNVNSNKWSVIKLALAAGLYPNLAMMSPKKNQLITEREKKVDFHSSSTLRNSIKELRANLKTSKTVNALPEFYIFDEITRVGVRNQCLIRGVTAVSPIMVFVNAKEVEVMSKNEEICEDSSDDEMETDEVIVIVDKWITFSISPSAVEKFLQFREMWQSFVNKNLSVSLQTNSDEDDEILKTFITVLDNEERAPHSR